MARVLIADDHAVVRAGLKQFLVEDRGISAIGEASTGRETLDRLRAESWDLVILDIGMPDRSGIDILQQIRAVHDRTRVLVLSGYPERQYALNVLRAGASGFIEKGTAPESVVATGEAFPGRSRPLCAYPKHAHYTGSGDPEDARNFVCRE